MVSAAELAVVGGAAGVGAVVGAVVAATHVSLVGQRLRQAPSVDVIDRQLTGLLQTGGTPADGGRALLRVVGTARPYDWARDGEAVA